MKSGTAGSRSALLLSTLVGLAPLHGVGDCRVATDRETKKGRALIALPGKSTFVLELD